MPADSPAQPQIAEDLPTAPDAFGYSLFNDLIDQFEENILIVDPQGTILNLNKSVMDLWGGSRRDFIGKSRTDLQQCDIDFFRNDAFFELVLAEGRRVTENYTEVTDDGRMNYYHVNAFPLHDEDGKICRLVLTRRNTTAEMQIEQRLYQSQKMAAIGELSTYIAHEIRNPLFAIGGFANALLRLPSLDDSAREKARIILEESQRLDEILKSIINFSRPTEQDIGAVSVNDLVIQTVDLMSICTDKDISIDTKLADNLPRIHGNAEVLKQCLINLIKNALEAMDQGTIHVSSRYVDNTVYLEVADNGPGIPQELQDKIFSPFFSTKDKGAGLGLAMTRKIINEIGGKLLLHSEVGDGTIITMALRPILAVDDTLPTGGKP